jgi:hypothetical protein
LELQFNPFSKMIMPAKPHIHDKYVHIIVPESLSDPSHFGHIVWKFCKFMKSIEEG